MKDINGKEITLDQTIERVTDDGTSFVGARYKVLMYPFHDTGEPVMCAKGPNGTLLLFKERAAEFKVVE